MANLVVMEAFSGIDNLTYCMVTPCECRMAMVMEAMWTPLLTIAVAKPLLRLCIVALNQPSPGAYILHSCHESPRHRYQLTFVHANQ